MLFTKILTNLVDSILIELDTKILFSALSVTLISHKLTTTEHFVGYRFFFITRKLMLRSSQIGRHYLHLYLFLCVDHIAMTSTFLSAEQFYFAKKKSTSLY